VLGWDPVRAADSGQWLGVSTLLGGGSSINGGVLWRAEAAAFEPLGFGANEVGAAFETIQAELSEPAPRTEYASVFADAWQKLGYPLVPGAGAASWAQPAVGVHTARTTFVGGKRRTAAHPLQERPNANLTVVLHARVERVLFKARRAYAVDARVESVGRVTLRVRRGGEVLLACGAIETPKLLMLSGVGPVNTLRRFDIPLVVESEGVGVRSRKRRIHSHRCAPSPRTDDDGCGRPI
jgi:choline dehydrogenase-like flavoprotein